MLTCQQIIHIPPCCGRFNAAKSLLPNSAMSCALLFYISYFDQSHLFVLCHTSLRLYTVTFAVVDWLLLLADNTLIKLCGLQGTA